MNEVIENDLVRFKSISRKKDGMFANYRVKGIKGGSVLNTTIAVDIASAEVDPGDSLEKIIEACAKVAVKECKRGDLRFEGLASI